jgi:hypothetical protein
MYNVSLGCINNQRRSQRLNVICTHLLHDFMNCCSICFIHFVELINSTDSEWARRGVKLTRISSKTKSGHFKIFTYPRSARTKAPPSSAISPVVASFVTAAVKPTPDEPLPVVYTPRGAIDATCFSN